MFSDNPEEGSQLSESGMQEQRELGARFRKRFPGLLDKAYDENKFTVGVIRML